MYRRRTFARRKSKAEKVQAVIGTGGRLLRSQWERNIARWLELLKTRGEIFDWAYEPEEFWFPIARGTRSYKPDFKVWDEEGSEPYFYEVKGYLDKPSATKLSRMRKYHPEVKILLIREDKYNEICASCSTLVEGWED